MKQEEKVSPQPENSMLTNEDERLRRDVYRPDMEKFRLFTEMLRRNQAFKKAVIRHK